MMERLQPLTDKAEQFLDGLLEAVAYVQARLQPKAALTIEIGDAGGVVIDAAGETHGLIAFDGGSDVADLASLLADHAVEILVPPTWVHRYNLPSTPRESLAFLSAFVAYQLERITPWRAVDVAYRIDTPPVPGDRSRCQVDVTLVPRHRMEKLLQTLRAAKPASVTLQIPPSLTQSGASISLDAAVDELRRKNQRRNLVLVLVASGVALTSLIGLSLWNGAKLKDEIASLDEQIATTRKILVQRSPRDGAVQEASGTSGTLSHPLSIDVLENLSSVLPDDAFLSEFSMRGDRLAITGSARQAADIATTLERSKRFADVAFSAPTSRNETGTGDTFHLVMRAQASAAGQAP